MAAGHPLLETPMFAVPELTVLSPLSHRSLSPTALVRSVTADPRWRDLLSTGSVPIRMPWNDPRVDIWLSAWQPRSHGPGVEHTYDALQGAFAVLSGQVVEYAGGRSRTLRPGQVRVFGPGYRHRVVNADADADAELAVTVHVQISAQPG
jgi:mannose-6-phosphate isomerase-like protein (cupin superfamily)